MTENEKREQLIDEILAVRSKWGGTGVGIYGADICALCGEIDTFRGWARAMFGTYFGPHREFVCRGCWHRIVPEGETGVGEQRRLLSAALSRSEVRYCQLCQKQVDRHPRWNDHAARLVHLCDPCRTALRAEGLTDPDELKQMLSDRVRRRYLELLDEGEIRQWRATVEDMREELDAQAGGG